jgi:hypothetical protein
MAKTFEGELKKIVKQSLKLQTTCNDEDWEKELSKFYTMIHKFFIFTRKEVAKLDKDIPEYNKVMKLFGVLEEKKVLTRVGERVWEMR